MTRYGPWIQEDDYDVSTSWTHSSGAYTARRAPMLLANGLYSNAQSTASVMRYFPGWSPVPDGDMMDLFAAALASVEIARDDVPANPAVRATRVARIHETGTIGSADWGDGGEVVINQFPYYVPLGVGSASELGWSPFYFEPAETPPGAVGIEFEDDSGGIATWQGAQLLASTQMRADNIDNSRWLGEPITSSPTTLIYTQSVADFNAPYSPDVPPPARYAIGSVFEPDPLVGLGPDPNVRPLGFNVDLGPHLGTNGCVLMTATEQFIAPEAADNPTLTLPNNYWDYGFYFDRLDIGWTLRPPRYRWIYDTVPIRRTFPRDDSLAGGAGRTWPPPKSAQQSNRTFGGYI